MIKLLNNKKLKPTEEDIQLLKLLRQQITLLEQSKVYGYITDEEYEMNMRMLSDNVSILEGKYGYTY